MTEEHWDFAWSHVAIHNVFRLTARSVGELTAREALFIRSAIKGARNVMKFVKPVRAATYDPANAWWQRAGSVPVRRAALQALTDQQVEDRCARAGLTPEEQTAIRGALACP